MFRDEFVVKKRFLNKRWSFNFFPAKKCTGMSFKKNRLGFSGFNGSGNGNSLSHEYLTSSHKPVLISLNYRCGLHRKLKELLYSQKYSHWVIVLHYCWLSLAASMGTTIKQYWSRNNCYNNFVKARDAFWRLQGRFWNRVLMMFYLNVFHLPTLKTLLDITSCGMRWCFGLHKWCATMFTSHGL